MPEVSALSGVIGERGLLLVLAAVVVAYVVRSLLGDLVRRRKSDEADAQQASQLAAQQAEVFTLLVSQLRHGDGNGAPSLDKLQSSIDEVKAEVAEVRTSQAAVLGRLEAGDRQFGELTSALAESQMLAAAEREELRAGLASLACRATGRCNYLAGQEG